MDARLGFLAILCAIGSLGASHRTTNFIVTADTKAFAAQVANSAEQMRDELAEQWLGKKLGPWREPCQVRVHASPNLGAGGATSFMFDRGRPFGWKMTIQGSKERILDSVLPHEVTHTIFATHFGRPLPRWADEGACTTVEHASERQMQHRFLIRFLNEERGIPFNRMFRIREYPRDVMPLYSQGYSVVKYLIYQGGRQKFVRFLGDGMNSERWDEAVQEHYGFDDLSDLQIRWVAWVKSGSPREFVARADIDKPKPAGDAIAGTTPPASSPLARTAATFLAAENNQAIDRTPIGSGEPAVIDRAISDRSAANYYVQQAARAAEKTGGVTTFRR